MVVFGGGKVLCGLCVCVCVWVGECVCALLVWRGQSILNISAPGPCVVTVEG
jgi:hypothetical protein